MTESAYAEQIAQISFDDRDLMLNTKKEKTFLPLLIRHMVNN